MVDIVVVGGLVPSLLIEQKIFLTTPTTVSNQDAPRQFTIPALTSEAT
jgi:hypothetical protein